MKSKFAPRFSGKKPATTATTTTQTTATKTTPATKTPTKSTKPSAVTPPPLSLEYKNTVAQHSYIGKRGYTIPKSVLTHEDLEALKKHLFMRPQQCGVVYGGGGGDTAFPVYRENANKIYIPRFYGIQKYGLPPKSELDAGENIQVPFPNPLRDYQEHIIGVYVNHVQRPQSQTDVVYGGGGILEVPCGRGKCLAKDTPVLLYNGQVKPVQDIRVGELLMGDDSTPRTVLSTTTGRERMYRITDVSPEGSGFSYVVNASHILTLKNASHEVVDINVEEYVRAGVSMKGFRVGVNFPETPLPSHIRTSNLAAKCVDWTSVTSIPPIFKCNSKKVRQGYLLGLVESHGKMILEPGVYPHYLIHHHHRGFCEDVVFLARSLGILAYIVPHPTQPNLLRIVLKTREIFTITNYGKGSNTHLDYPISVEALPEDDYYGFEIDGNHRFLLGDFTVTHNTIMALKIISLLGKKTLILVHKEFLMNQWIERMTDFLPTAKIGKIQAQTFDVEGKDVVIGMIQTLYDKVYPANTFASFGLTIIDEVHRIGSEQFSRTLLQTVTPYMLGISATVDRKDGLTDVLYHFIGPKIYSENRENDDKVCVRAIEYVCADREFNEVDVDFRGNPAYSKMISKLSNFIPRTEFVVRVLRDLLEEHEDSQIMVLAHQRELLKYIHDAVVARGIADGSVGFYVGGMKETALKVTEGKQIVLATYAMAAEALDIKSLSTLVMITPKTDIIQSVGRILRMKHEHPIVVDIVDKHDNFQKQWFQRRRFYKKCNYRIRQIASTEYAGMDLDWEVDRTWKWVFEPKGGSRATACVSDENGSEEEEEDETKVKKGGGCLIGASALAELETFHESQKI